MVNKYKLINPYIKGEFESKINASNSLSAAKTFYKSLSEHIYGANTLNDFDIVIIEKFN